MNMMLGTWENNTHVVTQSQKNVKDNFFSRKLGQLNISF